MAMVMSTNLKSIREKELSISREKLARRTQNVSIGTIRNAEYGNRITNTKAMEILNAVNAIRSEFQLPLVTLNDLGLILY